MGINEPEATFSPCFGGPFLLWHPSRYAALLAEKIRQHDAAVWLVNTGWSGGAFGVGSRMPLRFTRAIVDAIHNESLKSAPTVRDDIFGFDVVTACDGVPSEMMQPKQSWRDQVAYAETAGQLATSFKENFKKYASETSPEVAAAGPHG